MSIVVKNVARTLKTAISSPCMVFMTLQKTTWNASSSGHVNISIHVKSAQQVLLISQCLILFHPVTHQTTCAKQLVKTFWMWITLMPRMISLATTSARWKQIASSGLSSKYQTKSTSAFFSKTAKHMSHVTLTNVKQDQNEYLPNSKTILFTLAIIQCDSRKVKKFVYFRNGCENRNFKTTLWSKTFDFVYWGTFLTPNSEVFAQENFLNFWKTLIFQKKMLLKKFSNAISGPAVLK